MEENHPRNYKKAKKGERGYMRAQFEKSQELVMRERKKIEEKKAKHEVQKQEEMKTREQALIQDEAAKAAVEAEKKEYRKKEAQRNCSRYSLVFAEELASPAKTTDRDNDREKTATNSAIAVRFADINFILAVFKFICQFTSRRQTL